MSTTMTTTIRMSEAVAHASCPNCGIGLPGPNHSETAVDAQKQIEDLQAQVRLLTQKATAAGWSTLQHTVFGCCISQSDISQWTNGQTMKTKSNSLEQTSQHTASTIRLHSSVHLSTSELKTTARRATLTYRSRIVSPPCSATGNQHPISKPAPHPIARVSIAPRHQISSRP